MAMQENLRHTFEANGQHLMWRFPSSSHHHPAQTPSAHGYRRSAIHMPVPLGHKSVDHSSQADFGPRVHYYGVRDSYRIGKPNDIHLGYNIIQQPRDEYTQRPLTSSFQPSTLSSRPEMITPKEVRNHHAAIISCRRHHVEHREHY
jgi:hypothetical protein